MQCLGMPYDGALTGEFRIPVDAIPPIRWTLRRSSPAALLWSCRRTLS